MALKGNLRPTCIMCSNEVSRIGMCVDHYKIWLRSEFADIIQKKQNKPKPTCWPEDKSWEEYQVLARYSRRKFRTHCADCLPAYKVQMVAQGRCQNRETVFVERKGGEVVGMNRTQLNYWPMAVAGKLGKVVGMPDAEGLREGFKLVDANKRISQQRHGDLFEGKEGRCEPAEDC